MIAVPGFPFLGRADLCRCRHLVHPSDRPPARPLSFARQRYEADFRFSLARLREYAEQVALLSGENRKKVSLKTRFAAIVRNYFQIIACRKNLTAFTASYAQISPIIPYVVAAPFYFAGKITLGIMTQTARAFSASKALNFFVNYYVSLADYKAVLDRLTSFDLAIENAKTPGLHAKQARTRQRAQDISTSRRSMCGCRAAARSSKTRACGLPRRTRAFDRASGSGKSTFFRAISGIWPYGDGAITLPAEQKLCCCRKGLIFRSAPCAPP